MEYTITDQDIDRLCNRFVLNRADVMECLTSTQIELHATDFETFWLTYKRKGNRKQAAAQWQRMHSAQRAKAIEHAARYIASRELQYCKDAERYLKHEVYNDEIITAGNVATVADVIEYRDSLAAALGL